LVAGLPNRAGFCAKDWDDMRIAVLTFALLMAPAVAQAQNCPAPLASATRLALVIAPTLSGSAASLQRFERASPTAPWRAVGGPVSVLIGRRGLAWAHAFRAFARDGEPVKVDRDKRAPAGFFAIGRPFGFAAQGGPGYLHLSDGTVCVDDPSSPAYNTITRRSKTGWKVHGENMWRIRAYRHGLVVDYPTNRQAKAGSCIFVHLRLPKMTGTSGCVAMAEPQLKTLQKFAQPGAVLAVLPKQALARFKGCLPRAAAN
jgi:L,D-peptidoglycan transpeptidase YkuD (ErfK/YbiS/YcfS/YnhG family)